MNDQIGYRDIERQPVADSLWSRMNASPTGRQLAIDGNFVDTLVSSDPSLDPAFLPPDGTSVIWIDGASIFRSTFTRTTGWVSVEMTP